MSEITLHRKDLAKILEIVDELNPESDEKIGAGYVTIRETGHSGIGSIIEAVVKVKMGQHYGDLVVEISGVENW